MHEGVACELAFFHLRQLVFPFTGQLGFGEFLNPQAAQQRHQLKSLGRGNQFAAFAQHVFLSQQALDDGRARRRCAQSFFAHGFAELFVFHGLARAFHGAEQGGFAVARRRPGFQALGLGAVGVHHLAGLYRNQVLAFVAVLGIVYFGCRFLAVDSEPSRLHQHATRGFEMMAVSAYVHGADARGDLVLGRRIKHRNETAHHEVIQLLLGIR